VRVNPSADGIIRKCKQMGYGVAISTASCAGQARSYPTMIVLINTWTTHRICNYMCNMFTLYAVLVGGGNGDGAWRGLVTIVELIDPRPYIFSLPCTAD